MSARAEILGSVRKANGRVASVDEAHAAWLGLKREYRTATQAAPEELLDLFEDRLRDYDATVVRCGAAEIADHVGQMLAGRGKRRLLVPAGLPAEWLPASVEFVEDAGFEPIELDRFEGVLTGATVAIAETGTVVLQSVDGQGRRAVSLVPDYHLCVVRAEAVVGTVPEALARLAATAHLATTFVSGPSATADIEMTRIKGVHGPRFLDVVVVL